MGTCKLSSGRGCSKGSTLRRLFPVRTLLSPHHPPPTGGPLRMLYRPRADPRFSAYKVSFFPCQRNVLRFSPPVGWSGNSNCALEGFQRAFPSPTSYDFYSFFLLLSCFFFSSHWRETPVSSTPRWPPVPPKRELMDIKPPVIPLRS